MKPFTFGNWHAWQGTSGVLLSDEGTKVLRGFPDPDACINWLFVNGYKDVARALNRHTKVKAEQAVKWVNPSMSVEGDFSLQIEDERVLVEVVPAPGRGWAAVVWKKIGSFDLEAIDAIEGDFEVAVMGFRALAAKHIAPK